MIELPIYEIILPTSKKRIEMTPLIVREEKAIVAARETGKKSDSYLTFLSVLQRKINVPVEELNETDLIHCILNLRKYSIGEKIKVKFSCPHTTETIVLDLNTDNFKLKGTSKQSIVNESNYAIKIKVPNKQKTITSAIEYIETQNEKIDFSVMTHDQQEDVIDNLPLNIRNAILDGCNNLFHYEENLEYISGSKTRKLPIKSAEDFFTLCFAMSI